MTEIRQLDPHVADLIAAGEVVERPASVVKELVENAIDAGASAVTVEIQNGGMSLIRITDNGRGIPDGQCETAFLRHATSKLRTASDLEAIGTLGFRGEALAAIAAVSRVELLTCPPDACLGTALSLEGGKVLSHEEAGCPPGTTMLVRDLFFNTPARLKFMKKDSAEGAAVFALVQRLALSRPELSLKFLRDGKQELLTPGDGRLESTLYTVFGRDIALGFSPVHGTGEGVEVSGFVSMPACCRGTRGYQHFFVNGRFVKSKTLTAALERAYENQKMVGKFPGCVLQLTVKKNTVDVNVHPAKTEVKFLRERDIFDGVYYAVLSALTGERRHPPLHLPLNTSSAQTAKDPFPPKAALAETLWLSQTAQTGTVSPYTPLPPSHRRPAPEFSPKDTQNPPVAPKNVEKPVENVENFPPECGKLENTPPRTPGEAKLPPPESRFPPPEETAWRLVGELLRTYLVVEQGETIYLIDKHAAHERMRFDRMRQAGYRPMAQSLLTPVVFTPAPEEGAALLARLPLLEEFGFSCEDFGGGALVVRQIPFDLSPGETESTLGEIADTLLTQGSADPAAARDSVLHTMACKAAVRGGEKNAPEELREVAKAVLSGQVKYCPHGRPVAITLTRAQLERQFGRA